MDKNMVGNEDAVAEKATEEPALKLRSVKNRNGKRSIPLHVNILTVFTFIISLVVLCVVSYAYIRNTDAAVLSAGNLLHRIGQSIDERTQRVFDTAFVTVDTYVSFPGVGEKPNIHSHPLSPAFFRFLSENSDFTAIYVGFADGDFFLVSTLKGRESVKQELNIPQKAMWYTQTIRRLPNGRRYQLKKYLDAGFVTVGSQCTMDPGYDPARRLWFKESIQTNESVLSDIYIFAMSREPGLTVSKRFDNDIPGVIGVDMSLASLSGFLKRQEYGHGNEIIIFSREGEVLAYQDILRLTASIDSSMEHPTQASSVRMLNSPVLNGLTEEFAKSGKQRLSGIELEAEGEHYLAYVDPLPSEYGKDLYVGLAIPKTVFTGPIALIGRQTIFVSMAIFALFLPIIYVTSRRITSPLNRLTKSVEKVKAFDLESPIDVDSNIIEILELGKATETMRGTLKAFGSYIPKPLVRSMIVNDIVPELGGERRELTFLFTDIKDFTSISEELTPEHLMGSVSRYFRKMSRIILNNKGTIDKYIGDAIMAFWNAPVSASDHAAKACLTALQCRDALHLHNNGSNELNDPLFQTRMGVHTGTAVVGNIGSTDRMDYTAIGVAVNLASRLEGLNKFLGTEILVSETTRKAAGPFFQFRYAGKVVPKGSSKGMDIYELVGTTPDSTGVFGAHAVSQWIPEVHKQWEEAMSLFLSRDFQGARKNFAEYMAEHGADQLSSFYFELTMEYIQSPPGDGWSGELSFRHK